MSVFRGSGPVERDAVAAILDKAHIYPRRGVLVGGAPGFELQRSWNTVGAVPVGWSSYLGHRAVGGIALPPPESAEQLARLTQQEQATLAAARAAADPNGNGAPASPKGAR